MAAIWLLNGALPVLLWEGPLNLYGKWFLWQFFLGLLGLWWFWDYHRLIRRLKAMGQKFSSWVGQAGEEPISSLWWPSLKGAIQAVRDKLLESRRRLAHELEQSKALMHSLDDAVLALDCQGKALFFNGPWATAFVQKSVIDRLLRGDSVFEFWPQEEIAEMFRLVKSGGRARNRLLNLHHGLLNQSREFHVKATPLFEDKSCQDLYGVLFIFHDVTEIQQEQRKRLEFVENASHELRTPLTAIKGYLQLALQDLGPQEPAFGLVEKALKSVGRLVELVNHLLDVAFYERHRVVARSWFSVSTLMEEVLDSLKPLIEAHKVRIKWECQDMDPQDDVFLDKLKMQVVLVNLIKNSIVHNPEGVEVVVRWQAFDQGLRINVWDTGIGIPQENWPFLFERFYRLDRAKPKGSGLGLAIVKQLVELQKGSIKVVFPPWQKGAGFEIEFQGHVLLSQSPLVEIQ